jgi:hypothetical protein
MAIPWMTVLQLVPWTDVIRNAPAVLEGARKLWDTAARKPSRVSLPEPGDARTRPDLRIAALEERLASLEEQVAASSTLIKELAEQNANLIQRAELNRVLAVRLSWSLVVVGAVAAVAAWGAFSA